MAKESGQLPVFQTAAAEIAKATESDTSEEAIQALLGLAKRAGEYKTRKK